MQVSFRSRKKRKGPQSPRKRREQQRQQKRDVRGTQRVLLQSTVPARPPVTVSGAPDMDRAAAKFWKHVSEGPIYPCSSCNRSMYKHSVVQLSVSDFSESCSRAKLHILSLVHSKYYNKASKVSNDQHTAIMRKVLSLATVKPGPKGRLYLCHTCQRALKRSRVPTQAVVNSLQLSDIPPELKDLNDLEIRLLAQRTPFMKLVALPKGRQHAIHGPCVNVPSTLRSVCTLLPRLPETAQIIPLQFKRRLRYKVSYMFRHVRPKRIIDGLKWLKRYNQLYRNVLISTNWEENWLAKDPELFQAMVERGADSVSCPSIQDQSLQPSETPQSTAQDGSLEPLRCSGPSASVTPGLGLEDQMPPALPPRLSIQEPVVHKPSEAPPGVNVRLDTQQPGSDEHGIQLSIQCTDLSSCKHAIPDLNEFVGATPLQFREEAFMLAHIAHHMGFKVVDPPSSGGSCLYAALSILLPDIGHPALPPSLIRKSLANFLCLNPSSGGIVYSDFLPVEGNGDQASRWDAYLKGVASTAWGDHIAIVGLANMYNINIRVITAENPLLEPVRPHSAASPATVNLGLVAQYHYVALPVADEDAVADAEERTTIQQEIDAFDCAAKVRGLPLDTCLQKEDLIYSVAPSEGQKPVSILEDENFEEYAFPDCFPLGTGGYTSVKAANKDITPRKYFNQRILNVDGRFAKNIEYLLSAQYATESKDINSHVQIAMRQVGNNRPTVPVTAGTVKDSSYVETLIGKDTAFRFLAQVRGTPSYWKRMFNDVLAMQRQLGIPTWFLTLSAADLQWPDVIISIAQQKGHTLTERDVEEMDWKQKNAWLRSNPVTAARHFQRRLDSFFTVVLRSPPHPLGIVSDYVVRIEFQARGSPHAHCILWVKDAPKVDTNTDEEVIAFVERYQHGALPLHDTELKQLVDSRQTHVHNSSCLRQGSCRYHIPKPISPCSVISREPEEDKIAKVKKAAEILKQVYDVTSQIPQGSTIPTEEILANAGVSQEVYLDALRVNKTGTSLVLKRQHQDVYINNYNPDILRIWRANHDIQFIINPWSCIVYVTSYMLKSERAMGELLKQTSLEHKNEAIKQQMRKLGAKYLNNREVSAQEAAYRLLSMPLKRSSRDVIFVNSGPSEERVKILKPASALNAMEEDDPDIYCSNVISRYAQRPASLENLCLADFATWYRLSYNSTKETYDNDDQQTDSEEEIANTPSVEYGSNFPQTITLLCGTTLQKRRKQCILRSHTFNLEKAPEKHYRSKLMLYYPWRDEGIDLKAGYDSFKEHYDIVLEHIRANEMHFNQKANEVEDAINNLNENGPPEHAWARVAPTVEQEIEEQENEPLISVTNMSEEDLSNNEQLLSQENKRNRHTGTFLQFRTQRDPSLLSTQDYKDMMVGLNMEQQAAVFHHQRWCKQSLSELKHGKQPCPYHLFISGPGGVGKSHVIKLLQQDTLKILKRTTYFEPDDTVILITAPTGTAAFGVGGMTIHTALGFGFSSNITADKLNSLRMILERLYVLIIDEISMVSSQMLQKINQRLQLIKQSDELFGGVTVIAVGDLYQLKPVEGSFVFKQPSKTFNSIVCPDTLFSRFVLLELTKVMRQRDDQDFAEMLCRIRNGQVSPKDINVLQEKSRQPPPAPISSVVHTFATNKKVRAHNNQVLNLTETVVYSNPAIDSSMDIQTNHLQHTIEDNDRPISDTANLETHLQICVGARVMITCNIDVSDGLVNGATGYVSHIITARGIIDCILVKLESKNAGSEAKRANPHRKDFPGTVAITRFEAQFPITKGARRQCNSRAITIKRRQFPLSLAWGCTIHKMQGMTVESILVDMSGQFSPGQAYVALSRVKKLAGLHIRNFDQNKITFNPSVSNALSKMEQLPVNSNPYGDHTGILIGHLNIRCFSTNSPYMNRQSIVKELDCFCITETHLSPSDVLQVHHFPWNSSHCFRQDRNSSGGGVMVYAKKSARYTFTKISRTLTPLETITVACVLPSKDTLYICTVYRRPATHSSLVITALSQIVLELPPSAPQVFLGDFNEDLLTKPSPIRDYLTNDLHFSQLVLTPTTKYGSLLDHVYVKNCSTETTCHVHDTFYSDHDLTVLNISAY